MARLLLYVSASASMLYRRERTGLRLLAQVSPDGAGIPAVRGCLKGHTGALVQVVADLEGEDFYEDQIPCLRGAERRAVIERRLSQRYPDMRLGAALSLGHAADERRSERLLLASFNDAQPLGAWLGALEKEGARVASVHSTALLAPALGARLGASGERVLLMTANHAGVRQSFIDGGRLRFSRLARIRDPEGLTATLVRTETERMLKYLGTLRALPKNGAAARVLVVVPDAERAQLARTLGNGAGLAYTTVGLAEAARRAGLRRLPQGAGSEVLYLQLVARRPPKEQFLRGENRRPFVVWRLQRSLVGAGVAGFVSCGAYAATLWIEQLMMRERIEGVQRDAATAGDQLARARARLPATPAPIENLKASALEFRRLAARSASPEAAFTHVSRALDQSPQIELDALAWSAEPEQMLEVTGRINGAARADPRAIANEVQRFGALIGADAKWRVVATRLPFDLSSEGVLAASAGTETTDVARFSLRVARNPE
jgi:hypothetical protein